MKTTLYADLCAVFPVEEPADDVVGWRIVFPDSSAIGVLFASRRDAERTIDELENRGVVDLATYETAPKGTFNKSLAAALPW